MKKLVLITFILLVNVPFLSQEAVLFTIDDDNFLVSEFKKNYEKNLNILETEEAKDITQNVELFINYKLKVKEAYRLKLDTLTSYQNELRTYKRDLIKPYLQDTAFLNQLVKDAYFRTKNEIKAKHILVQLDKNATPKDTLEAYRKIVTIRNNILNNGDFETIAEQVSEDPSAKDDLKNGRKGNKGNLGYFSAFSMVYPFENVAYNTKVGEISLPFRTQFGYHIIKVDAIRPSKGEVEAAHILITDTTAVGKKKIEQVYAKLQQNNNFEDLAKEYSEDLRTKDNGGNLGVIGSGRMVRPLDDAIFSITEINNYSKPFKTQFGWHIVKLLKKYPVKSFEEMKETLTKKVKNSDRMQFKEVAFVTKLKSKYSIKENKEAKKILTRKNFKNIPKDSLQETIITINTKNYSQQEFVNFARGRHYIPVYELFEKFKNKQIINYYKDNLIYTEPEYAAILKEYEEGLLLFELMQQKIWSKASNDSIGLQKYFLKNEKKYKTKKLKDIKGKVLNDYQNAIENNWIADLRKKSKITINKKELDNLITTYQKK